jgi:hypothetical protein
MPFDQIPYSHLPYFNHFRESLPTATALVAQAADAKELRRRKLQSTRDKRRKGAKSANTD